MAINQIKLLCSDGSIAPLSRTLNIAFHDSISYNLPLQVITGRLFTASGHAAGAKISIFARYIFPLVRSQKCAPRSTLGYNPVKLITN